MLKYKERLKARLKKQSSKESHFEESEESEKNEEDDEAETSYIIVDKSVWKYQFEIKIQISQIKVRDYNDS